MDDHFYLDNVYFQTETIVELENELRKAKSKYSSDFNSVHEGYAVLLEEVDELWAECKMKVVDKEAMKKEAIQVAAMAIRFIQELT